MSNYNFEIAWAHITYTSLTPESAWCANKEFAYARDVGVTMTRVSAIRSAEIQRVRGRYIGLFLQSSADVLFFLDEDIWFQPGDAVECCRLAHEKQAVVGGLYSRREFGRGYASMFPDKVEGDEPEDCRFGVKDDKLLPAAFLAGGFLAIPRSAVEKMVSMLDWDKQDIEGVPPDRLLYLYDRSIKMVREESDEGHAFRYPNLFQQFHTPKIDGQGDYALRPEDYSFCERAHHCGIPLYIARRCVLVHIGPHGYTLADALRQDFRAKR